MTEVANEGHRNMTVRLFNKCTFLSCLKMASKRAHIQVSNFTVLEILIILWCIIICDDRKLSSVSQLSYRIVEIID